MFNGLFHKNWSTLKKLIWLRATALASSIKTYTGALVSFLCSKASPMLSLVCSISPVQEGSGDPSPDNVRPITGHDGVTAYARGKNLADINLLQATGITIADGVATGKALAFNGAFSRGITGLMIPANAQITLSATLWNDNNVSADGTGLYFSISYKDGTRSGLAWPNNTTSPLRKSVTSTANKEIDYIALDVSSKNNTWHIKDWQIEIGDTATDFTPYVGSTIPATIPTPPGTVYGGNLDLVSGVLTVDRASVDLGSLSWTESSIPGLFYALVSGMKAATVAKDRNKEIISSQYKPSTTTAINNTMVSGTMLRDANSQINIRDNAHAGEAGTAFGTAVTGQTLVYPLATPLVYQLTPQEISTLVGQNNVWQESGDNVSVTFKG